jgi:hypothetical protein
MAQEALQAALACPAAIAVHDDGYVVGQTLRVKAVVNRRFVRRQLMNTAGIE